MKVFQHNDFLCSETYGYEFLLFNTVACTSGTSLSSFDSRAACTFHRTEKMREEREEEKEGDNWSTLDRLNRMREM